MDRWASQKLPSTAFLDTQIYQHRPPRHVELAAITSAQGVVMRDAPYGGRLRTVQNSISGSNHSPRGALYVPPPPATVPDYMAAEDDIYPVEDLRAGWVAPIDFAVANPALFRLLSDPGRVVDSPAARSGKQVLQWRVHRIALTSRLRVSEPHAVNLIQAAEIGTIQTLLSTPEQGRERPLMFEWLDRAISALQQSLRGCPIYQRRAGQGGR